MFRLFRRAPRESFELDAADDVPPVGSEDAEAEPGPASGRRHSLKTILAFAIVAAGLGALYLSWSGGRADEPLPSRLLPQARPSLTQEGALPPRSTPPPPSSSAPSSSPSTAPGTSTSAAPQPPAPTFHLPLQRDPPDGGRLAATQPSGVPTPGPYGALAQASHEATVENLRAQIAELRLKTLKAELEADQLRKNPHRVLKEEKSAAEAKKEPGALERLARVPPTLLPIPGPIPAERQALAAPPAAPPAPPQMRVRLVTLEPREALIEAGDADSRGWFRVQEGQRFPDFVVTSIGQDGVTISFAGRGFFYPVGGYALGVLQENRQPGSRQASEPPRR